MLKVFGRPGGTCQVLHSDSSRRSHQSALPRAHGPSILMILVNCSPFRQKLASRGPGHLGTGDRERAASPRRKVFDRPGELGEGLKAQRVLAEVEPSPAHAFVWGRAKCLPSWPPSPEIRTVRAKFTEPRNLDAWRAGEKVSKDVFYTRYNV